MSNNLKIIQRKDLKSDDPIMWIRYNPGHTPWYTWILSDHRVFGDTVNSWVVFGTIREGLFYYVE